MHVRPPSSHLSATRMRVFHTVCQLRSLSETWGVGLGGGVETPIHVYISLLVRERPWPEVRKRELHWFWEEVIDESWVFEEEWMDGINILSLVFLEEFLVYYKHSLPALLSSMLFLFSLPPYHISIISHCFSLSLSAVSCRPSPPAPPHPCVLWHPTPALARQRAGPLISAS